MGTKVTEENFKMLFANCGYTVTDIWTESRFYFINIEEKSINVKHIEHLQMEGFELISIGKGVYNDIEVAYFKEFF